MSDQALCFQTATGMQRLIRSGELSSRELLEAHLDQIERVNGRVNAIVTLCADRAREQAAARYLAYRIDRDTQAEDVQLTVWSNESMQSEAFDGFYLSDLEYGVRSHHDHLRRLLPVMNLETPPDDKDVWNLNQALLSRS